MRQDLFERFLNEELDSYTLELFRVAIQEAKLLRGAVCAREFNLNLFDVVIDFEMEVVKIQDVLLPPMDEGVVLPLDDFISLCRI